MAYDWDFDALFLALPSIEYVPGRKKKLSPETAARLRAADDPKIRKRACDYPIELAEYWRLRDAGRVHSIYSRASRSRSQSPRTPSPPGLVQIGVRTRDYLKALLRPENARTKEAEESPEQQERFDYHFHRLEAIKKQRQQARVARIYRREKNEMGSSSSSETTVRIRGDGVLVRDPEDPL